MLALAKLIGIRGFIGLGVAAVLTFMLVGAKLEVAGLKGDLGKANKRADTAEASLKTCRDNVTALDGALTLQNEAVEAMKARGDQMATAAEKAASEARRAMRRADADAARLASFQSGATCEAREANVADLVAGVVR